MCSSCLLLWEHKAVIAVKALPLNCAVGSTYISDTENECFGRSVAINGMWDHAFAADFASVKLQERFKSSCNDR